MNFENITSHQKLRFFKALVREMTKIGGSTQDIVAVLQDENGTRYEEVVQATARTIHRTKPESDKTGFELDITYGREAAALFCERTFPHIKFAGDHCRLRMHMPYSGVRKEYVRFVEMERGSHKSIMPLAEEKGSLANIFHVMALCELAQKNEEFARKLAAVCPIYFYGTKYHGGYLCIGRGKNTPTTVWSFSVKRHPKPDTHSDGKVRVAVFYANR